MNDSATASPTDPFSTNLAGRRLGRYEVLARLASGGMAGVYVARALGVAGFERLFAVKVLHPHLAHEEQFITMFLDEARLAARIRHPNVVPTIDISDTQDAGYYLVMDYIEGDHLGALMRKAYELGTRLPAPVALRIMVDALEGLGAAHALTDESGQRINLVHRDVSPHNVMVSTDGIARLTDFGVAKAEVRLSSTRSRQFKGKLSYMAPEHASSGDADQRSDLFSAAIVLWECVTGTRLFRAENQAAILNKLCIEPIPMPSSVDPSLAPFDAILARALDRDPNQRFQTAEEFAEAIEQSAEALGGLANQRTVAKLVREYAGEKIDRDRELIRSSIAELGANPEPAQPAAEGPSPSYSGSASTVAYGAAPPIELPEPAEVARAQSRRMPMIVVGLVLLAAAAIAAALLMRGPAQPAVTATPLAPSTKEPPPAVVAPVQPIQPIAAPTPTAPALRVPEPRPAAPTARTRRTPVASTAPPPAGTTAPKTHKPKPDKQQDLMLNPYRTGR